MVRDIKENSPEQKKLRRVARAAAREARKMMVQSAKAAILVNSRLGERIKKEAINLLDWVLPTGKTLGKTTFGECAKLGGRFTELSKAGPADAEIGTVLTSDQVLEFLG